MFVCSELLFYETPLVKEYIFGIISFMTENSGNNVFVGALSRLEYEWGKWDNDILVHTMHFLGHLEMMRISWLNLYIGLLISEERVGRMIGG